MDTTNINIESEHWYAYRIFHNKMRYVKEQLSDDGIQSFSPIRLVQKKKEDEIVYHEVPIIPSLMFIRSTEAYMKELKKKYATHLSVYVNPCTKKEAIISDNEIDRKSVV